MCLASLFRVSLVGKKVILVLLPSVGKGTVRYLHVQLLNYSWNCGCPWNFSCIYRKVEVGFLRDKVPP